ncbi:DUF3152 domain-containing protein [Streptomyces sp. NPDC049585]|uniref:DUF3152 domain-containing protein n=1 Tax=Streptomyces sp. NPDC049585 TaxID=3155154 RepID=UPI003444E4ED
MGKHSARADRSPSGPAAAAPGTGRRRAHDGPGQPARGHETAPPPVPGPGPGRRRGGGCDEEAARLADAFDSFDPGLAPGIGAAVDSGFGPDFDAGYDAGYGAGPGAEGGTRPSARTGHPEPRETAGWGVIGAQRDGATAPAAPAGPTHATTGFLQGAPVPAPVPAPAPPPAAPAPASAPPRRVFGGALRTATGVAAALVTAVLAVAVAGQVQDSTQSKAQARAADPTGQRDDPEAPSRSDSRPTPNGGARPPATYEEAMARKYPLAPDARGSGDFVTIEGHDRAPGKGEVRRYRIDVEKGLPLDGSLFATAVHRTLNDSRSWGHGGKYTFERVSSGDADFVVTLASPGTTHVWCAKSGLDTSEDNVSCDSAVTDRVMINGYRWAQGSETYGDAMHAYRQMLINHEVGHRLGHDHESCPANGALAPVMMQQTKFLNTGDKVCRPNPWPFP